MLSKRLYKIIKTFLTYGLDELLPADKIPFSAKVARASLFWLRNKHKDKPIEQRFRLAIEELGPVFIKFGQMLSTRRDLLSPELAEEMALLQDKVAAFDGEQARQMILDAIGEDRFNQHFSNFEPQALASASIAQVHTATLHHENTDSGDCSEIVIKVIRPDIEPIIKADIRVMQKFAGLVERFYSEGKRLRPIEVVDEYRKTIFEELDLMREAANAIKLKRNFENDHVLYVPDIHSEFCTSNVMVMERIYGVGVGEIEQLHQQNVNMKLLAERGVEVFFTQVFRDSFFHADMHPGNVFVDTTNPDDPTWIAIDCGIVGTLNKDDKRYLAENFVAFFNRDYQKVAQLHVDSGWVPASTNVDDFEVAIRTVCEPIFEKPLAEISFGHVLVNLFNTARKFDMQVQPQLVLLQKTLLYIEGLGRQLYPQLDLWQTAKPFLETWVKDQMGPKALFSAIKENLPFWGEKLPELPDLVYDYLRSDRDKGHNQQVLLNEIKQQQQQHSHQLGLLVLGGGMFIVASIMYVNAELLFAACSGALGCILSTLGLKK